MAEIPWGSLIGGGIGTGIGAFGGPGMAALGGTIGAGLGGAFGGSKRKKPTVEYYERPEYQQLRNLLTSTIEGGFPEIQNLWQQQIMPDIQETYRAKRGLGVASTPEIAALGRGGVGLAADLAGRKTQLLQLLAGITPQPFGAMTQPGPTGLESLLSFGAPIAGGYLQNQAMAELFKNILSPAKEIQPEFTPWKKTAPLTSGYGAERGLF